MARLRRALLPVLLGTLLPTAAASAAGVRVRFDVGDPSGSIFPSDLFTVLDSSQNTFRRVRLPKPDCVARPSDCADLDVVNTLDGFNVQARLSLPFDGPIDPSTVTSANVFLISLGSTLGGGSIGHIVGINQVVWDPALLTAFAETDELLDQHTRYALVVTSGVQDAEGDAIGAAEGFEDFRHDLNFGQTKEESLKAYRKDLLDTLAVVHKLGLDAPHVVVVGLSIFTTQSATSTLEKVRAQIKARMPAPASFALAADGSRTVFPFAGLAGITFRRQIGTATFVNVPVPTALGLGAIPGAVPGPRPEMARPPGRGRHRGHPAHADRAR